MAARTNPWAEPLTCPIEDMKLFLMSVPDLPDSNRMAVRPQHLEEAKAAYEIGWALNGGPTFSKDATPVMNGSWQLLRAESEAAAIERLKRDIYCVGGAWDIEKINIQQPSSSMSHPVDLTLAAHQAQLAATKRSFDQVSAASSTELDHDPFATGTLPGSTLSTAPSSAVPTPLAATPADSSSLVQQQPATSLPPLPALPLEQDVAAPPPAKKAKTARAKPGNAASGGALSAADKAEYSRRSDQFLRAHADVFLPVLPEKNHVANLLKGFPVGTVHREAVPYKKLEQPKTIDNTCVMKDYQLHGLSFLAYQYENGQNCILADEMGLGKTLQTLSLLAYLNETHNTKGPHLLICPLSVLGSWVGEIQRWLPTFKHLRFHGPMSERHRLKAQCANEHPDLVVTTYEAYTAEASWFKHRRWGVVALDEGHKIKNHESNVSQSLHGIGAQMRLILSGTPLQNNLMELWALLHFLYPQIFTLTTLRSFRDAFNLTLGLYDQKFLKKSQALLELIMLRRTKEGVRSELSVPPREEMTLYVPLSPVQRFWYMRTLRRADMMTIGEIFKASKPTLENVKAETDALEGGEDKHAEADAQAKEHVEQAMAAAKSGEGNGWMKMMNLLMQLRKVCNHPYLLPNAEAEPFEVAEHIVAASSKLVLLDKLLADILPRGEKVLIFSGFTRMLDILEDFMSLRGIKYARLDGSTSRPRRALDIKLFQQANSPYQVYCISTRAGGLGINLTAATTVVMMDSDWNPQVDIQAISRAHRIGQTKTVHVYRLVVQDSVEEQALTRLRKKMYLSAKVMGSMRNATSSNGPEDEEVVQQREDDAPRMTRNELASILRGGASALGRWGSDSGDAYAAFRDTSFADLRERGRQRDEQKEAGLKLEAGEAVDEATKKRLEEEEEEAERLLLEGKEAVQARKFEGAVHKQTNADIRNEWQAMVARSSKSRTIMIDGHAVMKDTIACGSWEAVKTITSDPEMVKKLSNTKKYRSKYGHEDFCIVCKDGGDVYQCASCPRSCHGPCSGYTESELGAMMSWFCQQHSCTNCGRSTQEAGGLLFRCQTCPQSFCEDCLSQGDIEPVGEVLPEFLVLGMGKRSQAYYIRCPDCIEAFVAEPELAIRFREDEAEALGKLKEMGIEIP
ncbi:nucleosome remodeling complex ATPase subunit (Snf2h) [Pseudohyphozyma bogoriensis]|nr:nucleosome remodeling complex ATPase subunit (Snf2h) [Pseudohyphozyma bogoriensis]